MHPETQHGATGRRRKKDANLASFTSDTAAKTGKPERTIQRDATRAKALGPDLDRVARTSLDKGAELDALATMPADGRAPLIQRAAAAYRAQADALDIEAQAKRRLADEYDAAQARGEVASSNGGGECSGREAARNFIQAAWDSQKRHRDWLYLV